MARRFSTRHDHIAGTLRNYCHYICIPQDGVPDFGLILIFVNKTAEKLMSIGAENEPDLTKPPSQQTRSIRLLSLNQILLTALVLVALVITIALWGWTVWWGASKLIGLGL